MKLYYSAASPYARKVRACAYALGIEKQIQLVAVDASAPPEALTRANPLGRIPTLITEDGFAIFDSPVICEYLNGSSDVIPIIPLSGAGRWLCLRLEALGDGLMDAAVARRQLLLTAGLDRTHALCVRHDNAIQRTLDQLEQQKLSLHIDVGVLSIASALGYLDLRFADEPWRDGRPKISEWYKAISEHECLKATAPT